MSNTILEQEVGFNKWVRVKYVEHWGVYRYMKEGKVIECGRYGSYRYRWNPQKGKWTVRYDGEDGKEHDIELNDLDYINSLTSDMYDAKYTIVLSNNEMKFFGRIATRPLAQR